MLERGYVRDSWGKIGVYTPSLCEPKEVFAVRRKEVFQLVFSEEQRGYQNGGNESLRSQKDRSSIRGKLNPSPSSKAHEAIKPLFR